MLAPTRELSLQIHEEALKFTYKTGIKCVSVYGGSDSRIQLKDLDRGADIIIGTPGRLLDFIGRGRIKLNLIKYIVLDEADRMLDMGFEPQIKDLFSKVPTTDYEVTMFSATFPDEM